MLLICADIRVRCVSARGGEQSSLQEHFHSRRGGAEQQPGGELQEETQEIKKSELQRSWSHECLRSIYSSKYYL